MKRKVASRTLKRKCVHCLCSLKKGDVYYVNRFVYEDPDGICAYENLICAKCKYNREDSADRKQGFIKVCHHPEDQIDEVWSYIPGEAVMEPDHVECRLCGTWV